MGSSAALPEKECGLDWVLIEEDLAGLIFIVTVNIHGELICLNPFASL